MSQKTKKPTKPNATSKRKISVPGYNSFRLQKKIKHATTGKYKLPSAWALLKQTFAVLKIHWKFFGGIALVYGILGYIFVQSVSTGLDVQATKETLQELLGEGSGAASTVALFGILLGGGGGENNEVVSLYQTVLIIITSLALIWGLRQAQTSTTKKLRVKDAFYRGMQPLVPLLLVLLVIGLQLTLISIAASIYSIAIEGGLAVLAIEKALWWLLIILIVLLALYFLSSSVLALYIVTLPNMTPMRALRSARKLVQHRRFVVMRRLLIMPIFLLLLFGLIIIPTIAYIPTIAEPLFFLLSIFALPFIHAYIYNMYRSLL
jgi:hypothetical protein